MPLMVTGTPSILVPRAAGSAKHQDANARHLVAVGAAEVVDEEQAGRIPALIDSLLRDQARRGEMAAAARQVGRPDAAARIADALQEAAEVPHG